VTVPITKLISPEDLVSDYRMALSVFQELVEDLRTPKRGQTALFSRHGLNPTIVSGRKLVEWVLQTRAIPSGEERFLETVARIFGTIKSAPRNPIVWYDKNRPWLLYLLKAAEWGKREAVQEVATVGSFRVHNTIGADEKQFATIQALFADAEVALFSTLDFRKTLYGDVFVVGQIRQMSTLAWYSMKEDDVYIRSLSQRGVDDLLNLIHELGHRHWYRFTNPSQRRAISRLYVKLRSASSVSVKLPKVGDPMPVPISGLRTVPTIIGYDGTRYHLSSGGSVPARSVSNILHTQQIREKFPTAYSMTNIYEFFAECFALFTLKRLSPELAAEFEAALTE
jgi:hypothetical protein